MATRKLVTGHLEKVKGELFETHPEAIKSLIKGKSGVYALYRNNSLYYVGLASNLMRRLKAHLRDRHIGKWNRFSVYLTVHDNHMKELESLLLRIARPSGNRVSGRFTDSLPLKRTLNNLVKAEDDAKRDDLLGRKRRKRSPSNPGNADGNPILRRKFKRKRRRLRGWYKGYVYLATVRPNGTINYDGVSYSSPSAAAKSARGRRSNGWMFWHFKDPRTGDWVRLRTLKR